MKNLIVCLLGILISSLAATAQIEEPVKWSFSSVNLGDNKVEIRMVADIQPGWHVYSQFIEEGGPIPTSFTFTPSKDYTLIGKVSESPKAISSFDTNFKMKIAWHEKQVVFKQLIKVNYAGSIKGTVEFMVCNDQKCLPPEELEFSLPVAYKAAPAVLTPPELIANEGTQTTSTPFQDTLEKAKVVAPDTVVSKASSVKKLSAEPKEKDSSLIGIFIAGFIGGLLAFFMPCIYPMIPLTVSFFTKRAGSKAKGVQSALIYGISIIIIYVALGLLITAIFGASALNEAASSAVFNLLFFAILIIFAISFLGAFEITLPSSLVNKMDEKSNKGGFVGLFFMAFTLALVSFSCTGPIIGTLLVETVSKGAYLGPAIGMLGFSAALAIPFTLFAIFPSCLKEMPKSGGWMNAVKL